MEANSITDLLLLQNLVKRDPTAYRTEFKAQHADFLSTLELYRLAPAKDHKHFSALVKFLASVRQFPSPAPPLPPLHAPLSELFPQVAPCYPSELKDYPLQLADLLEHHAGSMTAELRKTLVQALILLRNRNLLSATSLLSLFFKLFRVKDKPLRLLLRSHIVNDIKRSNAKKYPPPPPHPSLPHALGGTMS